MNLRMPGQYYDAESGNFYNWNRYYKPSIGRYLSPDPIGQDGGINLFAYVDQNPVMASDPMGLEIPAPGYWDFYANPTNPNVAPDISLTMDKGLGCMVTCADELYRSSTDFAQGICTAAATPLSKNALGLPVLGNASKYTNPISYAGFFITKKWS